ncbi:ABC transporter ATP-binding protein [Cryobacterium sp. PH31-AA6]|uniref:ABC transporter ATP-binding protein n=1 Tax=Cryobacterium sp. PH31-AA6 TaxID=3046205 RepID=UPI0024BAE82B|nr:ABC transporter ATP-binding protein [Cryobacterium sp. PH31-AA6]MDJ0322681.1 ABC transporter ATP-binding protein [Cryobacterium sp. PH31-AA6]
MTTPAISTNQLSMRYGPKLALDALTLEVPAGEVFGLLGHNGAGKTTTVNVLTTLLEPTQGSAEVGGHSVTGDPRSVRQSIGYLPENVQFYDNLTLMENLRFFAQLSGLRRPDARIRDVLRILDFEGHDRQRLGTFSKGMRQRVGIAQAILHSPSVLFLDEPTSGLDPEGVRTLRETIVHLNSEFGMTIFMNTHLLAEVTKTCTSIGILKGGHLVHHDSLERTLAAFPGEDSLEAIYFQVESESAA